MKDERKFSHNCDQGDRLADMLGCGDEWLSLNDLCGRAADRITELEAQIEAVKDIGYETHPSWNCNKEFNAGWNTCRKQIDEVLKQENRNENDRRTWLYPYSD